MKPRTKLIFVYNADSGTLNALLDMAHKILHPKSYQCNLCSLTHGAVAERKAWKAFHERTDIEMEFLHRDEFEQRHGTAFSYPLILKQGERPEIFLNTSEIEHIRSVDELIGIIERRLG